VINRCLQIQKTADQYFASTKAGTQRTGPISSGGNERFSGDDFSGVLARGIAEVEVRTFRLLGRDPLTMPFAAQ
tara:strand:- start:79 stop:300 length:222 start_codon:yes stop_codon:yes gene_type:complete